MYQVIMNGKSAAVIQVCCTTPWAVHSGFTYNTQDIEPTALSQLLTNLYPIA